jgi:cysteine desulfurase
MNSAHSAIGRVYLDWNASAPLRPEAKAAMIAAMDLAGNASSVHAEGRRARAIVERAREQVAVLVGADPANVVFTSSASEAANHALTPDWIRDAAPAGFGGAYVCALEHPCVMAGGRFDPDRVIRVPVTADGLIDLDALRALLDAHDPKLGPPLVALMLANNETGIIQPVAAASAITKSHGGLLVCDAVQAAGRVPITVDEIGADAVLLSGHKIGGPKGAGALVLASEAARPAPLIRGGGQERRLRAGTENVAAIAGFGVAAETARQEIVASERIATARDQLEAVALANCPAATVVGRQMPRLPNTSLLAVPGASAETMVMRFDLAGIAVSAGAACSSGKVGRSHVLEAMGLTRSLADGAIRVSLGQATTPEHIQRFLEAWSEITRAHGARHAA